MSKFVRVPTLTAGRPIIDPKTGNPTVEYLSAMNTIINNLVVAVNAIADAVGLTEEVQLAAATAQAAADMAQTAAATAQAVADSTATQSKIVNSYTSPSAILSAQDQGDAVHCRIVIAPHTRVYDDGSSVAVSGATILNLNPSTTYWLYYDDADFSGGTVSFQTSTDPSTAGQGGTQHACGTVKTPAIGAPDLSGYGALPQGTYLREF